MITATATPRLGTVHSKGPQSTEAGCPAPHRKGLRSKEISQRTRFTRSSQSVFVRMLWAAFPSSSENELADKAAPVLGVTERQVKHWLKGENDGKAAHFTQLVLLLGVEKLAQIIEGHRP